MGRVNIDSVEVLTAPAGRAQKARHKAQNLAPGITKKRGYQSGYERSGFTNGNDNTPRICVWVNSITKRSTPRPKPPVGGIPVSKA